jgi:hypothetical protein
MIDLNKEAEEYENSFKDADGTESVDFIEGANSKFVKEQILLAQIEILQYQVDKLTMGLTKARSITECKQYTTPEIKLIQGDIMYQIEKLKEKL